MLIDCHVLKDGRFDKGIPSILNLLTLFTELWLCKRISLFLRNTHKNIKG